MLLCGKQCSENDVISNLSSDKWKNIKTKSQQWKGLDKFGSVYESYNWDSKPKQICMHTNCYTVLCGTKHRKQAEKRKSNQLKSSNENEKCEGNPAEKDHVMNQNQHDHPPVSFTRKAYVSGV